MDFKNWQEEINQNLINTLNSHLPQHEFSEVIKYSVLPAGKLFRPLLVYSMAQDLGGINPDHKKLAASLELHHTYTLIHDDLPAMDNDDMRRGRPSCHKQFNEWKAILAGDALINLSYEVLSSIDSNKLSELLPYYAKSMGAQGLILGQVMDLAGEDKSLDNILKIHELKTARLIQLALWGSNLLSAHPLPPTVAEKIGLALGVNFQLLDDLGELTEEISDHEKEINPFLNFEQDLIFHILNENNKYIQEQIQQHKLNTIKEYINLYLNKITDHLEQEQSKLEQFIKPEYLKFTSSLKL